jgi:hypothetical protein
MILQPRIFSCKWRNPIVVTIHILILILLIAIGIKLYGIVSDPLIIDIIEDDDFTTKLLFLFREFSIFVQTIFAYPEYRH